MRAEMALSGNQDIDQAIDLHTFAKAFIASLVVRHLSAVRPQSPADRRGFSKVVDMLDDEIHALQARHEDRRAIRQLTRIVNALRPSNSGAYDGFEAALRSIQLTLAECPNPFYEEITFPVPPSYAEATVKSLPEPHQQLVKKAAEAFLKAREA